MPIQAAPVMPSMAAPASDPFAFSAKPTTSATRFIAPRPKPSIMPWVIVGGAILLVGGGGIAYFALQPKGSSKPKPTEVAKSTPAIAAENTNNEQVAREKLNKVLAAWATNQDRDEFEKNNPDITSIDLNSTSSLLYVPQSFAITAMTQSQKGANTKYTFLVTLTYQSKAGTGINKVSTYDVTWQANTKKWLIMSTYAK